MALLSVDAGGVNLAIARSTLEAAGLETQGVDPKSLPLGGAAQAIFALRTELGQALSSAHEQFVATHYTEALATIGRAEAHAERFAGEPRVAQDLARLAVIAAQSGDRRGYARAFTRAPELTLDPARFSPDVREGFERAKAAQKLMPRAAVTIETQPAGASLYIDGVQRGTTPVKLELVLGPHALYFMREGSAPTAAVAVAVPNATLRFPLDPLPENERLGALRLRIELGEPIGGANLTLAARAFDVDAVVLFRRAQMEVEVSGPRIPTTRFKSAALDLGGVRDVLGQAGALVRSQCGIRHTPPDRSRAGQALSLKVESTGCVTEVEAAFRTDASQPFVHRNSAAHDGVARVNLSTSDVPASQRAYGLEYYLIGHSERGSVTASYGSETAPARIVIEGGPVPSAPRRWYQKWWVWTAVSAVVVGSVVGGVVGSIRPATEVRLVPSPTSP